MFSEPVSNYRTYFASTWLVSYLRKRTASEILSITIGDPLNIVALNQRSAVIAILWGIDKHFCGHTNISSFSLHSLLRTAQLGWQVRGVNGVRYPRIIKERYRNKAKVIQAKVYFLNSVVTFLYHCSVRSEIPIVHSPTNALFIKLGKVLKFTLKYTQISLLYVSVYDHHQGACTEHG